MTTPQMMRFTLAELVSCNLGDKVLANVGSRIHLVLTERQVDMPSEKLREACAIISVEDADGITVAVLKHRDGEIWDRRNERVVYTPEIAGTVRIDGLGRDPNYVAKGVRSEPGPVAWVKSEDPAASPHRSAGVRAEPLVPRRDPPHAAPAGEDRFQRGVDAMARHLSQQYDAGRMIRRIEFTFDFHSSGADIIEIDGSFSLRYLAKAFLDAYQPQITVSDQVRFKHAKRAMKLKLHHERVYGSLHFLSAFNDAIGEEQVDAWDDILELEGGIDIDALAKAFWSVMKGEG